MCEYLKALQKPFPAEDIEWRVSHARMTRNGPQALVLAYVTNRAIQERLDDVFGIAGWKNEYQEWRDKGVLCTISCKVDGEWIAKSDGADTTDLEATKGGFSNSMKRAAVQWGIGRYLYNLEQVWVNVNERGQNYISTQTKQREQIKGYWDTPKLPKWALPEGYELKDTKPQFDHHEPEMGGYEATDAPPSDEDLNNLMDAPPAQPPVTPPPPTQPQQRNETAAAVAARVYKIREEMGWTWPQLTEYCQDVLNRPVKFLKKDITDVADWKKIEQLLNDYRRKAS